MKKTVKVAIMFAFSLVVVASGLLAGCSGGQAALEMPNMEIFQYLLGTSVDFNDATLNQMAEGGGEAGYKFGIMKAIYPTVFHANKDRVAEILFPPPYKIRKSTDNASVTTYDMLTASDKQAVEGYIFANPYGDPELLTAAEQDIILNALAGFFNRQEVDVAGARALEQTTAYGILASSVSNAAAEAWKADAQAWLDQIEAKAASDYDGKTYVQLSVLEKAAVRAAVTVIDPETAFYRAMGQTSFRNGTASATYPDKRDAIVSSDYPGKSYAELNPMLEAPVVDAKVWAQLTDAEKAIVNESVAGLFNLANEQNSDPKALTENICYTTLLVLPAVMGGGQAAADAWKTAVESTTPGTGAEATEFYKILGGDNVTVGEATWKGLLTVRYYGESATYGGLSAASKAVIDQAADGMMGLAAVQRMGALPLSMNALYTSVLSPKVGATAAAGWEADVNAGKNMEWMLYKWLVFESFRNGTAASFYPTQVAEQVAQAKTAALISADTYSACNAYEKAIVNKMLWSVLGAGEQGYVQYAALPGLFSLVQAEMIDAVLLDQTMCYLTLNSNVSVTAAEGWKSDVEAGTHYRQAFYRWLAKEGVSAMTSAGLLIQLSVAEFYVKVTNPNDYAISVDRMTVNCQVDVSGQLVDTAKQALGDEIWIPANGEIIVRLLAPVKTLDMVTWAVLSGKDSRTAQTLASTVWSKVQARTADWTVTIEAQVSNGEQKTQTYTLEWAGTQS